MDSFSDYKTDAASWITLATGEYYPDILPYACELYKPVLILFGQLIKSSESSETLFRQIGEVNESWMRVQLSRVFRKYVSPETPVEMLKKKTLIDEICKNFGKKFRPINQVQKAFASRPNPDEALCAILWEYKDRGKKGYDLTEKLFALLKSHLPKIRVEGPERAGKDILLGNVFKGYPNSKRPVDFVLYEKDKNVPLAIGLARYDSDRGGAQEDDRTGGYFNCAKEILSFTQKRRLSTKIIFVNDGPGLLLGSMWDDYAKLEKSGKGNIIVVTLRMMPERITIDWLKG